MERNSTMLELRRASCCQPVAGRWRRHANRSTRSRWP